MTATVYMTGKYGIVYGTADGYKHVKINGVCHSHGYEGRFWDEYLIAVINNDAWATRNP